jgi:uncharacterized protein (DUF1919 family)
MTHHDCGSECLKRTNPLILNQLPLDDTPRPEISEPLTLISENSWSDCQLIQSHLNSDQRSPLLQIWLLNSEGLDVPE